MTITVYTAPNCQACKLTKMHLDRRHLSYSEVPMNDEIRAVAIEQGQLGAPVVQADDQLWGSYRPDRIDALMV